ncbi:hypothetical protein, partial [Ferviditalea candida]|nr:hypothetical protein [Paenibacillaceae bacterium T2]
MQLGLGLQLATLSLKEYVQADSVPGYWLAAVAFIVTIFLIGNKKYPAALFVIMLGAVYAFTFKLDTAIVAQSIGLHLPEFQVPTVQDVLTGFVLLALPQVPLSLGNSVLGTKQIVQDLFPDRSLSVR